MQVVNSINNIISFDSSHKPAAVVELGERFELRCQDCFGNAYFKAETNKADVTYNNPCTGPVFINGVVPGDVLRVEIEKIITEDLGIVEVVPRVGPLGDYITQKVIKKLPIKNGRVIFSNTLSIPVKPMIGVLGVTPAGAPVPTVDLGDYGGNLDCNSLAPGAAVLLPVSVPGAMLAAGDFHAVMGDGELGVSGLEVAGSCILKVDVIKNFKIEGPVIFYKDALEILAIAPTLDIAVDKATKRLYKILHDQTKLSPEDISAVISLGADIKVCQIVNSQMSAAVKIPLSFLPYLKSV